MQAHTARLRRRPDAPDTPSTRPYTSPTRLARRRGLFRPTLLTFVVTAALSTAVALAVVIAEVVRHVRQRCKSLSIERLLESIPDVAYKQKPDRDGGYPSEEVEEEEERKELRRSQSSCVICMEQYEGGERCSVLPGCGHVFHRGCVATWLHTTHDTCPLCRATIGAGAVARKDNAAEDMG